MKKVWMPLLLAVLALSLVGCGDPCKEGLMTSLGDTMATIGKKGLDKDKILTERKAERAAACAQKQGNAMKKSLGF